MDARPDTLRRSRVSFQPTRLREAARLGASRFNAPRRARKREPKTARTAQRRRLAAINVQLGAEKGGKKKIRPSSYCKDSARASLANDMGNPSTGNAPALVASSAEVRRCKCGCSTTVCIPAVKSPSVPLVLSFFNAIVARGWAYEKHTCRTSRPFQARVGGMQKCCLFERIRHRERFTGEFKVFPATAAETGTKKI